MRSSSGISSPTRRLPACGFTITVNGPYGLGIARILPAGASANDLRRRCTPRRLGSRPPRPRVRSRRFPRGDVGDWRSRSSSCLQFRTKSPGAIVVSRRTSSSGLPSAQWNTGVAKPSSSSRHSSTWCASSAPPDVGPRGLEPPVALGDLRGGHVAATRHALPGLVDDGGDERGGLGGRQPRGGPSAMASATRTSPSP